MMFFGHNQPLGEGLGYGYLYNWYTIDSNSTNLITDLHVPSNTEFTTLEDYLTSDGHSGTEGTALKSTSGWISGNGTDDYGFAGMPGGFRYGVGDGTFTLAGSVGYWWSATEYTSSNAYGLWLIFSSTEIDRVISHKSYGCSVRCMRTLTAQEQIDYSDGEVVETKDDYDGNSYDVIRIGTQGWSTTNLKTTHYLNGTVLTKVTNNSAWAALTTEGYCAYDNDESNV